MRYLTIIACGLLLSGCAVFGELEDRGAEEIASALDEYCSNSDQNWRDNFRAKVNAEFAGTIEVTCP